MEAVVLEVQLVVGGGCNLFMRGESEIGRKLVFLRFSPEQSLADSTVVLVALQPPSQQVILIISR